MTNRFTLAAAALIAAAVTPARAQTSANWPVYGGSDDHTHYTTLGQITPANVKQLKVAWTYETHDEFDGSEMQTNPIVVDGVLYATTPEAARLRARRGDGQGAVELRSQRRRRADVAHPASRRRRHRRPRAVQLSQPPLRARQAHRPADPLVRRQRLGGPARGARSAGGRTLGEREHAGRRVRGPAHHGQHACPRRCPVRPATSAPMT